MKGLHTKPHSSNVVADAELSVNVKSEHVVQNRNFAQSLFQQTMRLCGVRVQNSTQH